MEILTQSNVDPVVVTVIDRIRPSDIELIVSKLNVDGVVVIRKVSQTPSTTVSLWLTIISILSDIGISLGGSSNA